MHDRLEGGVRIGWKQVGGGNSQNREAANAVQRRKVPHKGASFGDVLAAVGVLHLCRWYQQPKESSEGDLFVWLHVFVAVLDGDLGEGDAGGGAVAGGEHAGEVQRGVTVL